MIYKVNGHSGITGNDMARQIAKIGAKKTPKSEPRKLQILQVVLCALGIKVTRFFQMLRLHFGIVMGRGQETVRTEHSIRPILA